MILIGNLAAFAGCMMMVLIGFIKKKERILLAQCLQFGFLGLGNLCLGATAGFISGIVSVTRNLVFYKVKGTLGLKLGFIGLQVLLTLLTWNGGLIECVPVLAAVLLTWFLDTKSDVQFKLIIIAVQVLWGIYDWHYANYVAFTADILTMLSNFIGILMIYKSAKSKSTA